MQPKKSLGQNFLMHPATAVRIAKSAGLPPRSHVLEIGPGTGMLTRALLDEGFRVTAIEMDSELLPHLQEVFSEELKNTALTLVKGDIRTFDLSTLPKGYSVVANIPYYITGEIVRSLLTAKHKPESMTLLVQKEVAVRIARSEKESILSLSVKVFGTPSIAFSVPRGAFRPAPKVDSAVLTIQSIRSPFKKPSEEKAFFDSIHTGFGQKRKRLAKNLEALYPKERIEKALVSLELSPNVRAEDLSLSVWFSILKELSCA